MASIHSTYHFPSATGITDIFMQSFCPQNKESIKGIIAVVHGMAEHSDRYIEIAEYLCTKGYTVFMHDHAGHGKSVATEEDLGYFSKENGNEKIVDDVKGVVELINKVFPGKPVILWGHSMGSFVTRRFVAKYPAAVTGAVICGTAGANPAAGAGILIAKTIEKLLGGHHRSDFLDKMAFGTYNKKFEKKTGFEWLSVNENNVDVYVKDPLCGYRFTANGFRNLFALLKSVSDKKWYDAVPDIPLYLIAGDMDPVGNYGKGVEEVFNKLKASGHTKVSLKLYKGLRHEIHNENERYEVLDDIVSFADSVI
ncbi:MAG: lysophospholipase [Clostridia bacterium]|nr:lysophospholipase [Clostridia bacterium]